MLCCMCQMHRHNQVRATIYQNRRQRRTFCFLASHHHRSRSREHSVPPLVASFTIFIAPARRLQLGWSHRRWRASDFVTKTSRSALLPLSPPSNKTPLAIPETSPASRIRLAAHTELLEQSWDLEIDTSLRDLFILKVIHDT